MAVAAFASRAAADPLPPTPTECTGGAAAVAADPAPGAPIHVQTESQIVTYGGSRLTLPPGYFMDEPAWAKLDGEVRRLQDAETRLTAENKSLRSSARAFSCDVKCVALLVVVGVATGVVVGIKL